MRSFEVPNSRSSADLYIVVIVVKSLLVISIFRCLIRHNPYKCAVIITDSSFTSSHRGGNQLIEVAITTHKKLHILLVVQ